MKHRKLTWKLGIAAIAALGLSVMPAHFNVPGVGTVQAFASADTVGEVTFPVDSKVYDGNAQNLDDLITKVTKAGDTDGADVKSNCTISWVASEGGKVSNGEATEAGTYTGTVKISDNDGDVGKTVVYKISALNISGTGEFAYAGITDKTLSSYQDFFSYSDDELANALGDITFTPEGGGAVTITDMVDVSIADESKTSAAGKKTISISTKSGVKNIEKFATDEITVPKKDASNVFDVDVAEAEFTGQKIEPTVTVKEDGITLTRGTHYRYEVSGEQIEVKSNASDRGLVTVTGINDYDGTTTKKFVITKTTKTPSVTLSATTAQYTGQSVAPTVTVKLGSVTLKDTYYSVEWKIKDKNGDWQDAASVVKPGTYKVVITSNNIADKALAGIDNQFTVTGSSLKNVKLENFSSKVWYTGEEITFPDLIVKLGDKELVEGTDITITPGEDNTNVGEGTLTITGSDTDGEYVDSYVAKFSIIKPELSKYGEVTLAKTELTYTGKAQALNLSKGDVKSVVIKGTGLEDKVFNKYSELSDTFEIVTYKGNTNVGTATATLKAVTARQDVYGTEGIPISFKIVAADLSDATVTVDPAAVLTYTGEAIEPAVTVDVNGTELKKTTDYTIAYSDNVNVGTATVTITGKNNYTGTATETFKITKAALDRAYLSVSDIEDQTYTGSEIKPAGLTVKDKDTGKVYAEGTDYTLSYANNIEVGDSAKVMITGAGNYELAETDLTTFKIVPAEIGKDALVDEIASQVYTGSAITPVKVVQTVGDKKVELKAGTDYTVEYKDNIEIGTASYTVTGKNNYTGTATGTFAIGNDFSAATVAAIKAVTYTGKALKPAVTVTLGDATLKAGTDYTVAYSNNTNAGQATVTITPAGSYAGDAKTVNFTINKAKVNAKVTKITGKNAVGAGKTITLKATLNPAKSNANQTVNTKVTWKSNKTAIAKVDKNGKVTGVSAGKAKITVKAAGGSKSQIVTVYGIASKNLKQTVKAGKTKNVSANDTIKSAKSSNTKVATVTYKGKKVVIKGVKKGTAKVTVTTKNGGKNVITVTVK